MQRRVAGVLILLAMLVTLLWTVWPGGAPPAGDRGAGVVGREAPPPQPATRPSLAASDAPAPREPEAAAPPRPAGIVIAGRVLDARGAPVAGADVHCGPRAAGDRIATSSPDGTFAARIAAAEAVISASAPGFGPSEEVALRATGDAQPVTLTLTEPLGSLDGTILVPGGRPPSQATIEVGAAAPARSDPQASRPTGSRAVSSTTEADAHGRFRVDGLLPGTVKVLVVAAGCAPWHGEAVVRPNTTTALEVTLETGVALTGRVRNAAGEPMAGVRVWVEELGGRRSMLTDAEGGYAFRHIGRGSNRVGVDAGTSGGASAVIAFAGADVLWDPVVSTGDTIRGRLLDERGAPLAGWQVRLFAPAPRGFHGGEARTGQDGRFQFTNRDGGAFSIELSRGRGELPIRTLSEVRADGAERVIVVSDAELPSAALVGRVLDPDGADLAGAFVQAFALNRASQASGRSEADGRFRIGPVPGGRYIVTVFSRDYAVLHCGVATVAAGATVDLGRLAFARPAEVAIVFSPTSLAIESLVTYSVALKTGGALDAYVLPRRWTARAQEALAPGEYVLRWVGNRVMNGERELSVRSADRIEVSLPLVRAPGRRIVFFARRRTLGWVQYRVRDAQGAVVDEQNVSRNSDGEVLCNPFLAPGTYRVEATSDGMETVANEPLHVAEYDAETLVRRIELR